MRMWKNAAALCAVLGIAACGTGLKTIVLPPDTTVGNGIIYYLPTSDLVVTVNYRLLNCAGGIATIAVTDTAVAARVTPEKTVPLLIQQSDISNWFKTVDNLGINIGPTGLLQSVNYKAKDHTGEVLVAAAKLAAGIAGGGIVPTGTLEKKDDLTIRCADAAEKALAARTSKQGEVQRRWDALQQAEAKLAGQDSPENRSARDLASRYYELAKADLAKAAANLAQTETVVCRPDSGGCKTIIPWKRLIAGWATDSASKGIDALEPKVTISGAATDTITMISAAGLKSLIEPLVKENKYIFYRTMAPAAAKVTAGETSDDFVIEIYQLGRLASLEFTNTLFQSASYGADFDETGLLKKFTYVESAARAKVLVDSLNDARKAAIDMELEDLDKQISREKKRKDLLDAEKARRAAE